ncbi:carbohydrate kinase family protein [Cellulomonas massiliensis]|uniref:carbohydrate kinase family protein n=1 Tax=Cellulomonas massiliensis TaxID=1465811 RepID=UPI0002F2A97B|nr:carbohydrate kinase family protein [Cellulomonas massiliensis]
MTEVQQGGATPVLVVGDANVDLVLRGDVAPRFGQAEQLLDSGDLVLGGSASIVACGLARLGVPTTLVARVGDDVLGRFTLDVLRGCGVRTELVEVDPVLPTGLSVILSAPDDRAILTVPGTIPTLTPARVAQVLAASDARHVHVASYFLQPALAAGLPGVLAAARARGMTTSLDTNWDPAERWSGVADLLDALDVLLPNVAELRALAGAVGESAADDRGLGRRLAARGPRVVVKAGADGGWSVAPDGSEHRADGLPVDVVDTTGAGDSFDAGYLAALAHGVQDEDERLRWAATAGSLSTLGAGGTGRQATLADLAAAGVP